MHASVPIAAFVCWHLLPDAEREPKTTLSLLQPPGPSESIKERAVGLFLGSARYLNRQQGLSFCVSESPKP